MQAWFQPDEAVVRQRRSTPFLQRQCAYRNHVVGDAHETGKNKREGKLQRAAISLSPANKAPPIVHDVLRSPGQPLDVGMRAYMEPRFGHDFSDVRVHTDAVAAQSAQAVDALAYTVGRHIVFDAGQYAPGTGAGQRLLAHELAHTVQQDQHGIEAHTGILMGRPGDPAEHEARHAAEQVPAGQPAGMLGVERQPALRRQEPDDERRLRLQQPQLGQSLGFRRPRIGLGVPQLRLDPEIEAQLRMIELLRDLITLDNLRTGAAQLGGGFGALPPGAPTLFPAPGQGSVGTPQPAGGLGQPLPPAPAPLVPRGTGPEPARGASVGDLLQAVLAIPMVQSGVTRLRIQAEGEVRRSWRLLSGGERALVITQGVLIAGGAIAGIASDPAARQFVLDQVQGRTIPIPGLPVTFQFNLTGPDQRLVIGLDLGALLPSSLGFGPR